MDDSRSETDGMAQRPRRLPGLSDDAPRPVDADEETVDDETETDFREGYKMSWRW
jgi:hypothetical protein